MTTSELPPLRLKSTRGLLTDWWGPVRVLANGDLGIAVCPEGQVVPDSAVEGTEFDMFRSECRDRVRRGICQVLGRDPEAGLRISVVRREQEGKVRLHVQGYLNRIHVGGFYVEQVIDIPGLDLDPRDDRLLPDGSRWLDAAALTALGEHLLLPKGDPDA